MDVAEQLAHELLRWWHSSSRSSATPDWLAPDITFDSGLGLLRGDEVATSVRQFCAWENVTILASFGTGVQAALIYEGIDPVTDLRRREAWIVSVVEGKIAHILAVDMISYADTQSPRS